MLNLLTIFSLKRSPLLSQFHNSYAALLCPAISCPAFSCPVIWSVNFTSVIFTSSIFSAPGAVLGGGEKTSPVADLGLRLVPHYTALTLKLIKSQNVSVAADALVPDLLHGDRPTPTRDARWRTTRLYAHAFRRGRKHLYLAQGLIGCQLPRDTVSRA